MIKNHINLFKLNIISGDMTVQPLETKGLFSRTRFSAGGTRLAYDLEKHLILPAPPETIFDLTRDNAHVFAREVQDLFRGRPLQIFSKEIVRSDTYGLRNVSGEIQEYGWTSFRDYALMDNIEFNPGGKGSITLRLKDTERGFERESFWLDNMLKFAFLRKRSSNVHVRDVCGLYLSRAPSLEMPFSQRSESVYVIKG